MTLALTPHRNHMVYGPNHHIVEMRGGVTDAGQTTNKQTNSEDGATQPMEAGG